MAAPKAYSGIHRAEPAGRTGRRVLLGLLVLTVLLGSSLSLSGISGRSLPAASTGRNADTVAGSVLPAPNVMSVPSMTPTPSNVSGPGARPSTPTPEPSPSGVSTIQAYLTGYSYFDNTPPGSVEISHPVLHARADGTGTYTDPITVAVGHSMVGGRDVLDWPAGTRFYVPNLRRYFIVEDTCGDGSSPQAGPCHIGYRAPATTWLDLWVGGRGGSTGYVDECMDRITGVWDVLVDPAPTHATVAGAIYGSAGCTRQYGNTAVIH